MKILDGIIETKNAFRDIQEYGKAAKWCDKESEYYEKYGRERIMLWRKLRKIKNIKNIK